jgi:hypothetical protein
MTPPQIVQRAIDEGVVKLLLVPAAELSTSQGHLLCYLPNIDALQRFLAQRDLANRGTAGLTLSDGNSSMLHDDDEKELHGTPQRACFTSMKGKNSAACCSPRSRH